MGSLEGHIEDANTLSTVVATPLNYTHALTLYYTLCLKKPGTHYCASSTNPREICCRTT